MVHGVLLLLTSLGCSPGTGLPWGPSMEAAPSPDSPGLLVLTLEDAPASRFTPWGGTDDRLDAFANLGTTWLRAYAPTPQRQPNLATLWTGTPPDQHGVWLDGLQVLPDHHELLLEALSEGGWHTAASTGTLLTDDRWGLLQGARSQSVHDDAKPNDLPAAAVVDRLEVREEPQAAWVHLPADGLGAIEPLVGRWVEAHPEGWVVVVGVHGRGSGLVLDDDALRMPLVIVGPGFGAGELRSEVVGLHQVAPSLRALAGLPAGGPRLADGPEVVEHSAHLGRSLFGSAVLHGATQADGRVVVGTEARWYGALGSRIPADGHVVPRDHGAVAAHLGRRARAATDMAPLAFVPLVERGRLAQIAPHTLGDPDATAGDRDPAPGQATFVEAVPMPLAVKQYRRLHRIADEQEGTPFGELLRALAARGQADADIASAALEAGAELSAGPTFAWHRAEVALDRCRIEEASEWFAQVLAAEPLRPAPTSVLLHRARALGPLPPPLADQADRLLASWPQHPYVAPLADPLAITHLPVRAGSPVTGLLRARAAWTRGHATQAIEALRAAVSADPMDCTLRVELARWTLEADEHLAAQRLLAPLVRANPDEPVLQKLWADVQVSPEERYERKLDRTYNRP